MRDRRLLRRGPAVLTIAPEKVCFIIVKAREFDAKVAPEDGEPGSNPADDGEVTILEDRADDPTYQELIGAIEQLNEDEQLDLVVLTWVGRGDFAKEEWKDAQVEARLARNKRTALYLAGTPLLGDYLEEGLAELGLSCEEYEIGRL